MMAQSLVILALAIQGLLTPVDGNVSLLARPPIGKRAAGFIVNENTTHNTKMSPSSSESASSSAAAAAAASSPSFVSVGIRSSCARERAATLRNEGEAGASAATRLRGGSWGPGYAPFVPQLLHAADTKPKERVTSDRLDTCTDREHQAASSGTGAQFTTSKQRVLDDSTDNSADSYEDEEEDGGGAGGAGGGGGGGRVGALPSFPRTLPAGNGKAAFNKKFAWVP